MLLVKIVFIIVVVNCTSGVKRDLAWTGGPLHSECGIGKELLNDKRQHVKENVVAVKAVVLNDNIYVLTPRLKHGVLATIWRVVEGRKGPELQAFPDLQSHALADCSALQNALDFYLDHFGTLWVLDTGVIDTLEAPRCTCRPKVLVISLLLGKVTKTIDLSSVAEPSSLLQTIVVEHGIDGTYVYVSDASRGAILVHDLSAGASWSVVTLAPSAALQLAVTKRGPHSVLVALQIPYHGLVEMDTAALKRKHSRNPLTVSGEHSKSMLILGADSRHVFVRHAACADVLAWDSRDAFNSSKLRDVHSPVPRLIPTSVTAELLKHSLVILDSNYAETVPRNLPTYHRITFLDKI